MNLGLLLIPVLAGYWCLTHLNYTRYSVLRATGYHLFFQAAFFGVLLLAVSYVITHISAQEYPQLNARWKEFVPLDYAGAAILSLLLGVVIPAFSNYFYGKDKAEKNEVRKSGDRMDRILQESIDDEILVELSLKNRKSYIGLVIGDEITNYGGPDIALIPTASGYRDKDTLMLIVTTNYTPVMERLKWDPKAPDLLPEDFQIVIPKSEVSSIRPFNLAIYDLFQNPTG